MGYRFSLESANTVANLAFGRVYSCYRDVFSSDENYTNFMYFLEQYQENMYSNDPELYTSIRWIQKTLHSCVNKKFYHQNSVYDGEYSCFENDALMALSALSDIFQRCTIKSLLLPSIDGNAKDEFMLSSRLLQELVLTHPRESCLILQPQEHPGKATIFNAFPNFDVALRQADLWPAVLFWEDEDKYAFVPVRHAHELLYLYRIIKYERHPIRELKKIADHKNSGCHYIFQLSDLHFGAKRVDIAERRIKVLIKSQLSRLENKDSIRFIITGDAVDSPTHTAECEYQEFADFLQERCGKKTIRVLGNHDINCKGLAFSHDRQHISHIVGEYPRLEKLEDPKVILLLFNSNTNGHFAEGEIGTEQMAEMGNKLDQIKNLHDYLLIAVLHHHVVPIPKPDYYDQKWYEKIFPDAFIDETLKLNDADIFTKWLIRRNVKFVIHGHKHIPYIGENKGIHVICCGSSTGRITHKEKGKTHICYNLIKISDHKLSCTQFAEDILGAGEQNLRTQVFSF